MSPWGHWNGDKKAKGPPAGSPRSHSFFSVVGGAHPNPQNIPKWRRKPGKTMCRSARSEKKNNMISYDFLIFMDTKTYHFCTRLGWEGDWIIGQNPTFRLAMDSQTNLSWCFGSLVYKLCPIQSNPNYGPNMCIWALIYRIRQKILKYGTSKLSCKEIWKPPQLTKPYPSIPPCLDQFKAGSRQSSASVRRRIPHLKIGDEGCYPLVN